MTKTIRTLILLLSILLAVGIAPTSTSSTAAVEEELQTFPLRSAVLIATSPAPAGLAQDQIVDVKVIGEFSYFGRVELTIGMRHSSGLFFLHPLSNCDAPNSFWCLLDGRGSTWIVACNSENELGVRACPLFQRQLVGGNLVEKRLPRGVLVTPSFVHAHPDPLSADQRTRIVIQFTDGFVVVTKGSTLRP